MRTVLVLCLAVGGMACAWAQGSDAAAERARIEAVRTQKSAELDAEDAACLSRFAVTDCQNAVGQRRRQMLSELKRQEDSLNAVQRQQKGVEQLQRVENKAADDARRREEARANAEKTEPQDRHKALEDKRKAHQQQGQSATQRVPSNKTTSVLDAATVEKNRAAYADKLNALEKRRQERDQRVLDHGRGGPPLPAASR